MSKEVRRVVVCPGCQIQITVSLVDFKGQIRMLCNSCKLPMTNLNQRDRYIEGKVEVKKTASLNSQDKSTDKIRNYHKNRTQTADRISLEELTKEYNANKTPNPDTGISKVDIPTLSSIPTPQSPFPELDGYQILKKIGQGTMGEIFLAKKKNENRHYAIKFLNKELQKDKSAEQRFFQEARVQSLLKHPNIVRVIQAGNFQKRLFIIMEYIKGQSLAEILEEKKCISPKHSLQISIAIANALEHALERNIIHRDLKPANVLIEDRTRRVKLADFGLGKILEEKGDTLTGQMMGTAYYMPPEQIRNAKDVDHRADVYSLGATIYHMLCGQPPYGEIKTLVGVLRAKIMQEPLPLEDFVKNVPSVVIQIAEKAMARKVKMRYQTPGEMREAMQQALTQL